MRVGRSGWSRSELDWGGAPQEVSSVQADGASTARSKMVFVMNQPGANPITVKHKARLVVCGHLLPHVSDIAAQNLDVIAMKVSLSLGLAWTSHWQRGCQGRCPQCRFEGLGERSDFPSQHIDEARSDEPR